MIFDDINAELNELADLELESVKFSHPVAEEWDDFGEEIDIEICEEEEDYDPNPYPQEPWEDDYSDLDPVDMYGAEWENYALRDWD